MSCMLIAPACGDDEDLPLTDFAMKELKRTGLEAMKELLGCEPEQLKPPGKQCTGASLRTDGRMFYLSVVAPKADQSQAGEWTGAFYAPFGFFDICGIVRAEPAEQNTSTVTVGARLLQGRNEVLSAKWTVTGPHMSIRTPNRATLIKSIDVGISGPHDERDIRACIARHAPERAWGVPRAVVTLQCGVAVACLVEAIC